MSNIVLFIIGLPTAIFSIYKLMNTKGIKSVLFFVLTIFSSVLCFPFLTGSKSENNNLVINSKIDYEYGENIKTQSDLNDYISYYAKKHCERHSISFSYKNEEKQMEAKLEAEHDDFQFMNLVIPAVVRNNDLPESYILIARDLFEKQMEDCKWIKEESKVAN